ncbi:MAG TPA: hypothetical protein VEK14_02280, partial [Rhodomicrobium sp.]|nr:hypothetical protein [Rhodomicrobium sp.]
MSIDSDLGGSIYCESGWGVLLERASRMRFSKSVMPFAASPACAGAAWGLRRGGAVSCFVL